MAIERLHYTENELKRNANYIMDEIDNNKDNLTLEKKSLSKVVHLLNNSDITKTLNYITDKKKVIDFRYGDLVDVYDKISFLERKIGDLKEEIELDKFFKTGKVVDFVKLKEIFDKRGIKNKFPNFKWVEFKHLINEPMLEVENYKGDKIKYDKYLVKKLNIAILQMIFNEMDLYIINSGQEGSGKSCFCSQMILYVYTFLKRVGLVEYAYDVKKLFFSSIASLLDEQDLQKYNDYFRIMALDEAYDLNRSNYHEQTSVMFKDDMRSARKLLRINFLNIPQIGELDVSITLSRANMIFYCKMDNDTRTGTLKKGIAEMYIIPRGKSIYSPYHKRNITRVEILKTFAKQLEKKGDYYLELPKSCLITEIKFKNVWGFNKGEYDKFIKAENKKKRLAGNLKFTNNLAYILYKKMPPVKDWGTFGVSKPDKEANPERYAQDMRMYQTLAKWLQMIKNKMISDPDLYRKLEVHYNGKDVASFEDGKEQ